MKNSEELSIYGAGQLPLLLTAKPDCKFVGLKINKEIDQTALHSIFLQKSELLERLPFSAVIRIKEWVGKSEPEEFFFEALTAERLVEDLHHFDKAGVFVFFEISSSITLDTMNTAPQPLLCRLFPELGEFDDNTTDEQLKSLKEKSMTLLDGLMIRLNRQ